jgi:hypothetical protein
VARQCGTGGHLGAGRADEQPRRFVNTLALRGRNSGSRRVSQHTSRIHSTKRSLQSAAMVIPLITSEFCDIRMTCNRTWSTETSWSPGKMEHVSAAAPQRTTSFTCRETMRKCNFTNLVAEVMNDQQSKFLAKERAGES